MFQHPFFLCIFIACCLNSAAWSQSLEEKVDILIKRSLPNANVAILVTEARTGQVLYSKNANKLVTPASGIKLFTAAAALYHLEPQQHFFTTLAQKGHNIYLLFGGSPSLTIDNFNNLLLHLKKNTIQKIDGDIILDTTRFKSPSYPGGISYDDLGWYYTAPDSAVMLDENSEVYEIITAKNLGMPVTIKSKNPNNQLRLINQIITVNKEDEKKHCTLNVEIQSNNTLRLYGCVAQDKQPKKIQLAIPDPLFMTEQLIKKSLNKQDITLKGRIISGKMPADAQIIAQYRSGSIEQLVTHMLKDSDNLYANSLTKQLAFSLTQEGTNKQGAFAIKEILAKHTNLDMSQLEITDGMGTRYNLVTPQQMVLLLTNLYNDKILRTLFLNALPQAGVSGTLKDRFKKTKLEQKVFAKTGTMHDISSLSGYVITSKGRALIFSIIINGINKPITIAKSLEEQILLTVLAATPDSPELENAFG